jgi:CRP-like cAMP-binding protein
MSIEKEVMDLARSALFESMDPARLRLMAMSADRVKFKPGDTIIRKGDAAKHVFIVLNGRAETTEGLQAAELIGAIGVFLQNEHAATIRATTEVEALCLNKDDFLSVVSNCSETSLAILREFSRVIHRQLSQPGQIVERSS